MMKAGEAQSVQQSDIERVLGNRVARLIEVIAQQADKDNLPLYLAGGAVRDLLLNQRNLDIDFVVAGDAISFCQSLAQYHGGRVQAHRSFGTAKWTLADAAASQLLAGSLAEMPAHLDFVTARSETYAQPAALPTVTAADIMRDMLRRDFSVNALAIQISPCEQSGRVFDFCHGIDDLKRGLIRALHARSFVDDPTRILRALRYARRLGFELEAKSAGWLKAALPYLGRVTGKRLSNEIDLILREPLAGEIMLRAQEMGALSSIHDAFHVNRQLPKLISRCQKRQPPWTTAAIDRQALRWLALFTDLSSADAREICERLALTKALTEAIIASARLAERIGPLDDPALRPSRVAQMLAPFPELALQFGWLLLAEKPSAQEAIAAYASKWRQCRPTISGADLKDRGLAPGPRYRQILDQLRFAWLDDEIRSYDDEAELLQRLLDAEEPESASS